MFVICIWDISLGPLKMNIQVNHCWTRLQRALSGISLRQMDSFQASEPARETDNKSMRALWGFPKMDANKQMAKYSSWGLFFQTSGQNVKLGQVKSHQSWVKVEVNTKTSHSKLKVKSCQCQGHCEAQRKVKVKLVSKKSQFPKSLSLSFKKVKKSQEKVRSGEMRWKSDESQEKIRSCLTSIWWNLDDDQWRWGQVKVDGHQAKLR